MQSDNDYVVDVNVNVDDVVDVDFYCSVRICYSICYHKAKHVACLDDPLQGALALA